MLIKEASPTIGYCRPRFGEMHPRNARSGKLPLRWGCCEEIGKAWSTDGVVSGKLAAYCHSNKIAEEDFKDVRSYWLTMHSGEFYKYLSAYIHIKPFLFLKNSIQNQKINKHARINHPKYPHNILSIPLCPRQHHRPRPTTRRI